MSRLAEAYRFLVRTLQRKNTGTQIHSPSPQENLWNKENTVNSPTGFGQRCISLWENKIKSPSTKKSEVFIKRSGLVGWC